MRDEKAGTAAPVGTASSRLRGNRPAVGNALNHFTGRTDVWADATVTGVAADAESVHGRVASLCEGVTR
ncbi:hypothetical protein OIE73_22580 [Streptomyces hirsutus]|uniref:Uncharacterized protein n=1 Tax=Streptomyces hirsutus TaxID=35620 RepID=A0ABZ1GPZ5_9ACTN|nr:hypothetical protein [Streptomyces hirsutus]WSD08236.1 hypothetical protein OIE73_22580 [Streptomyces hirsutus]